MASETTWGGATPIGMVHGKIKIDPTSINLVGTTPLIAAAPTFPDRLAARHPDWRGFPLFTEDLK